MRVKVYGKLCKRIIIFNQKKFGTVGWALAFELKVACFFVRELEFFV